MAFIPSRGVEDARVWRVQRTPRNLAPHQNEEAMPKIPFAIPGAEGLTLHCAVDDYLWPWQDPTPVVMLHGFARNARFWNRWVPAIAETRRVYRPELIGCGESDVPPAGYRFTPDSIAEQVIATLDALALARVHWVGESSGGIVGVLLA